METALACTVMLPPTSNGCPRKVSQAGPRIGIADRAKAGAPISTVTRWIRPPSSCNRRRRTPPGVWMPNSDASVNPRSCTSMPTHRAPLPHISAGLPSALR